MAKREIRYLSQYDILEIGLGMEEIIEIVEEDFRQKGQGTAKVPPKVGIDVGDRGYMHAMPAAMENLGVSGIKWVSGYPTDPVRGFPHIMGLLVLNDVGTGAPLAVMDATWITEARTPAVTAVGAKYLARPDSSTVGVIGAGRQGTGNAIALSKVLPLKLIKVADADPEALARSAETISRATDAEVRPMRSIQEAVAGSDVVVTAIPWTGEPTPVVQDDWLEPGAFAVPVDLDQAWPLDIYKRVDRFATDDVGQMEAFHAHGAFSGGLPPMIELADIVTGTAPGRMSSDERTMLVHLGIAIHDVAVGKRLYDLAVERGIGTQLPWM
jgi:ornithine cyclodeaminase/alanine dehydrogenase